MNQPLRKLLESQVSFFEDHHYHPDYFVTAVWKSYKASGYRDADDLGRVPNLQDIEEMKKEALDKLNQTLANVFEEIAELVDTTV